MEDAYFFLVRQPDTGEVMILFKSNRSMVVPKILEIQFKLGFLYLPSCKGLRFTSFG